MILSVQNNPRHQQQQGQGSTPAGYNRESFKIEGSILAGYNREYFKIDYGEHFLSQPDLSLTNQKTQFVETRDDEDILLALAHQKYKAGNYSQALEHCNVVYEKNPQRTDNLLLLGAIYYQLHDFDMCITKNEEAIRIDPQFAECYGNMANAWKEKGNIDLAIQFYLIAIELRPNFCDAWSNLAFAYLCKGRLTEAAKCFRQALHLNPHLAYLCYMEALRIQPTFVIAWSNLAGLFMEAGDYAKAFAYYKEAIRLKPNFVDAHLNQGNVLKVMGRPQDAIMCYQRAIQLRPDYAIAYGVQTGTPIWELKDDLGSSLDL